MVDLDPSEKAAIFYYFGLTITKLLAARLLNAPWPQHLDKFEGSLSPSISRKERPDLVARDHTGQWIALEAKGRSNALRSNAMAKAKQPVGTYFAKGNLQAEIHDPAEDPKRRADLKIGDEAFIKDYYAPLTRLFLEPIGVPGNPMIENGLRFRTVVFPEVDMTVGIAEPILANYERKEALNEVALRIAKSLSSEVQPRKMPKRGDQSVNGISTLTVGQDGILVALGPSWSDEQMRLDPNKRKGL